MTSHTYLGSHRRGTAYILALIFIALFAAISFATAASSFMGLKRSENAERALNARLTAESGLSYCLYQLRKIRLPPDTNETNFATKLTAALGERLDATTNLAGQTVFQDGPAVFIPTIAVSERGRFAGSVSWIGAGMARLGVTGDFESVCRSLSVDLRLVPKLAKAFNYGLASKGQVVISGSARILGANNPQEASVFSAASLPGSIIVDGSDVTISGDLSVSGDETSVVLIDNPSIGGTSDPNEVTQHIHFGIEAPDFPVVDTSYLAPLATNVIDSSTVIPSGAVLNNVRIAAGTNPSFNNDVVLNGIVYIEAPNKVTFNGHATINGFIVTEDKDLPLKDCQLSFLGTMDSHGVESLPDIPLFEQVKQHTGTFLVAPGFDVKFAGSFGTINGSIAADQMTWKGTADGVIKGSVIGLENLPMTVGGNVEIEVDRSHLDDNPAGFVKSFGLEPQIDTYVELIEQ